MKAVELTFLQERSKGRDLARAAGADADGGGRVHRPRCASGSTGLIERVRGLLATEVYRPNPAANCRYCDFKPLCPLWPEGRPALPVEVAS